MCDGHVLAGRRYKVRCLDDGDLSGGQEQVRSRLEQATRCMWAGDEEVQQHLFGDEPLSPSRPVETDWTVPEHLQVRTQSMC